MVLYYINMVLLNKGHSFGSNVMGQNKISTIEVSYSFLVGSFGGSTIFF